MAGGSGGSAFACGVRILADGGYFREILRRSRTGDCLHDIEIRNALEGMQRDIADMGLQGRIFAGRHGFPAVAEKEVGQAHAAQLDGIKIAVALRVAHDQFRTAAAYVDEQAQFVAAFQPAGHAEINQAGFLLSRHDGEVDTRPFPHPEDKFLSVVRVAHGGRGNGDNLRRFVHRAHFGQPAQNAYGSAHGLFLKAVMHESALAEAHHVLDLIQNRGRSVRMNTDNQQPEGIAAQIDDADIPFRRRDYPARHMHSSSRSKRCANKSPFFRTRALSSGQSFRQSRESTTLCGLMSATQPLTSLLCV